MRSLRAAALPPVSDPVVQQVLTPGDRHALLQAESKEQTS